MMQTRTAVTSGNVDLTNCDREQIQYAGAIQPHGVMLVLQEPDLLILQASQNSKQLLGVAAAELVGRALERCLPDDQVENFRHRLSLEKLDTGPKHIGRAVWNGSEFDALAHRYDQVLILELELRFSQDASPVLDLYSDLRTSVSKLEAVTGLQPFFDLAVQQIRALSGFDRVMIYQFLEDGSGWVRSEAAAGGLEPYLGLRYPASDIPAPARRLFSLTWIRHQPDIGYKPVPMIPQTNPVTGMSLDMSYALLRSVSIMYVDYLKNMGTQSSMVMTLLKNHQLWGLIACHHHSGPKHVPYETRVACEFLTHTVSLLLSAKEDLETSGYRSHLKSARLPIAEEITRSFIDGHPARELASSFLQFIRADGAAISIKDHVSVVGTTPAEDEIHHIVQWLRATAKDDIFATNCLADFLPEAAVLKDRCAGLIALRFSKASDGFVIWFRPEILQTVHWAGDPGKPVNISEDGRLSPRGSFALWKEEVRLRSAPWSDVEKEAVADLQAELGDAFFKLNEEGTRQMYADLERSHAELNSFAYIASHDLKEPLRGIHNYAEMIREDNADQLDEEGKARLASVSRLSNRMDELIDSLLEYSRVGAAKFSNKIVELDRALNDALDFSQARIKEQNVKVHIKGPLPAVKGDYIRIVEVFANLISNAIKYNDKMQKEIEVGLDKPALNGFPVIYVRDNGIGIQEKHHERVFEIFRRLHGRNDFGGGSGAGLTIVKKIIERHGGQIWLDSTVGRGTTFLFTLGQDVPLGEKSEVY